MKPAFRLLAVQGKDGLRKRLFGTASKRGSILSVMLYGILSLVSFTYLYPMLYMLSVSLMSTMDLLDVSTNWIPSAITLENYAKAFGVLRFPQTFAKNIFLALVPTVIQVYICNSVGYGFARFRFPCKKLLLGLLLFSYLMPLQSYSMPKFLLLQDFKLLDGTIRPFLLTSALGQGIRSALCILVFYNFHRQAPAVLTEAAEIDGAGPIRTYFRIAVPMTTAAIVAVTLLTFVWYWNDEYIVNLYLSGSTEASLTTLMRELGAFEATYKRLEFPAIMERELMSKQRSTIHTGTIMAGTLLSLAPMLLFYICLQKQFVSSIDNVGITGE